MRAAARRGGGLPVLAASGTVSLGTPFSGSGLGLLLPFSRSTLSKMPYGQEPPSGLECVPARTRHWLGTKQGSREAAFKFRISVARTVLHDIFEIQMQRN